MGSAEEDEEGGERMSECVDQGREGKAASVPSFLLPDPTTALKREVRGYGPGDARIVLVGEAPGANEVRAGVPFVGGAGQELDLWLKLAGIARSEVRIENVVERKPLKNEIDTVPRAELDGWMRDLRHRLGQLPRLEVVVPLGKTALRAVMEWEKGKSSVMAWRGTVLEGWVGGRSVKVLPMLHPAAVMRVPAWKRRVEYDLEKLKDLARGVVHAAPEREIVYNTTKLRPEVEVVLGTDAPLAIDIETAGGKVTCVGVATGEGFAQVLSLHYPDYANGLVSGHTELALRSVRRVCESVNPKILHNGGYDWYWEWVKHGIGIENYIWDTRWMHHALYPSDAGQGDENARGRFGSDHALGYLASVYTDEPYWKGESKGTDRVTQLRYNGKDCCVTHELWRKLKEELEEREAMGVYERSYQSLFMPLLDIGLRGVRVDGKARKARKKEFLARCEEIGGRLDALNGCDREALGKWEAAYEKFKAAYAELKGQKGKEVTEKRRELMAARKEAKEKRDGLKALSLFGATGGESGPKMQGFLKDKLGLPLRRRAGKVTIDEVTLRQLYVKYGHSNVEARKAIPLVLERRTLKKQAGTFLSEKIEDRDGRVRCSYSFTPETGRLSSSTSPLGTGMNLQNVQRETRDIFLPDEGCVFLEVDLSAAEGRVIRMLTQDSRMVAMARARPDEFDQHRYNAAMMFGVSEDDVTFEQRDTAKRSEYGTCYGMAPKMMSETWLKNTEGRVVRTEKECERLQDMYIGRAMPVLPEWQAEVRKEIMQYGCLSTMWGRVLDLRYARLDAETYKRGYAFKPQSIVGELLNQYGLRPMWYWLRGEGAWTGAVINIQLHDALYFSCPVGSVWEVAKQTQQFLERPLVYYGQPMTIPVSFKVGGAWGSGTEWKMLPGREEMETVARAAVAG